MLALLITFAALLLSAAIFFASNHRPGRTNPDPDVLRYFADAEAKRLARNAGRVDHYYANRDRVLAQQKHYREKCRLAKKPEGCTPERRESLLAYWTPERKAAASKTSLQHYANKRAAAAALLAAAAPAAPRKYTKRNLGVAKAVDNGRAYQQAYYQSVKATGNTALTFNQIPAAAPVVPYLPGPGIPQYGARALA